MDYADDRSAGRSEHEMLRRRWYPVLLLAMASPMGTLLRGLISGAVEGSTARENSQLRTEWGPGRWGLVLWVGGKNHK